MGVAGAAGPGARSTGRTTTRRRHRMHAELARRRAYLHLCRWTSLGLSLIEAMQIGMPVLALATTEAVAAVPPDAGVLVHPRRHPGRGRPLADRASPTTARRLGARARQVAAGPLRPGPVPRGLGPACWRRKTCASR